MTTTLAMTAVQAVAEIPDRRMSEEPAAYGQPAPWREYAIALTWIAGVAAIRWFLHPVLVSVSPC